jgi:hypothetical protein
VTLGESGFERFQIWLDGNQTKVLHPNATEGMKDVQVHGPVPESECFGSCWQIDGRYKFQWSAQTADAVQQGGGSTGCFTKVGSPDVGKPGDQYKVKLETIGKYRTITWEKLVEDGDGEELAIKALVTSCRYGVIGTFTGWKLQDMSREETEAGVLHTCEVRLSYAGDEFQIVVNDDSRRTLYPEWSGSGPGFALGPDELAVGRTWKLGGVTGDIFRITLARTVSSDVMMTEVHWERISHDAAAALPVSYYVIGDWDHFARPLMMTPRGSGTYTLQRAMPRDGNESFLILCEGSYSLQIHPSMAGASPHSYHTIRGPSPDAWKQGLCWTIGAHPMDEHLRGCSYEIHLEMSGMHVIRPKKVTWGAAILPEVTETSQGNDGE